jgi:hypothetical protein
VVMPVVDSTEAPSGVIFLGMLVSALVLSALRAYMVRQLVKCTVRPSPAEHSRSDAFSVCADEFVRMRVCGHARAHALVHVFACVHACKYLCLYAFTRGALCVCVCVCSWVTRREAGLGCATPPEKGRARATAEGVPRVGLLAGHPREGRHHQGLRNVAHPVKTQVRA